MSNDPRIDAHEAQGVPVEEHAPTRAYRFASALRDAPGVPEDAFAVSRLHGVKTYSGRPFEIVGAVAQMTSGTHMEVVVYVTPHIAAQISSATRSGPNLTLYSPDVIFPTGTTRVLDVGNPESAEDLSTPISLQNGFVLTPPLTRITFGGIVAPLVGDDTGRRYVHTIVRMSLSMIVAGRTLGDDRLMWPSTIGGRTYKEFVRDEVYNPNPLARWHFAPVIIGPELTDNEFPYGPTGEFLVYVPPEGGNKEVYYPEITVNEDLSGRMGPMVSPEGVIRNITSIASEYPDPGIWSNYWSEIVPIAQWPSWFYAYPGEGIQVFVNQ